MSKEGVRPRGDVKSDTLKKSLDEFPAHFLKIVGDRQMVEEDICRGGREGMGEGVW